ncbi:MAG: ABC transporter permease subunit [Opitutae bacterium]|nr:ABC transporter permease subunit [Opitutae bacterium]MBT7852797.1 ABC transporter permease subunit [Opitutae bacterium]
MKTIYYLFKREFLGYFRSPVAYVFLFVFAGASAVMALNLGKMLETNDASMRTLFHYQPWIFLVFIPAIGMRLWAEEKRSGTWELLFTLPITPIQAVLGKFLAAWIFVLVAICLTITMVLTIGYLGNPDWGPVLTGYFGLFLMAGSFMAVTSLTSAFTKNQVISFVISTLVTLIFLFLGWSVFSGFLEGFLPMEIADAVAQFSFITHFEPFQNGVVSLKGLLYFLSFTVFCLFVNVIVLER